jgi:hypothetical protein
VSDPFVVIMNNKITLNQIDDVLSLNNSRFDDFVVRIYPIELEIKDITDTDRIVKLKDRASFFSFFLRGPSMKSASYE